MMFQGYGLEIRKRGKAYDEIIRHFMTNLEYPLPDMKRHKDSAKLFLANIGSWNETFIRKVGKNAFEFKKGRTRNGRACIIIIRNPYLEIIELDDRFHLEIDNIPLKHKQ